MHLNRVVDLLNKRDFNSACKVCEQIVERYPDHFDALNLLAVCYLELEQTERAIKYLERACKINNREPKTIFNLGISYAKLKRFSKARDCFEKCNHLIPDNPDIINATGNTYRLMHDYSKAKQLFDQALKINPQHLSCLQNLAWLELSTENYQRSLSLFQQVLKHQPDDIELLRGLGDCLVKIGHYEQADTIYQKALHISSGSANLLNSLGVLYIKLGENDKAISTFNNVLSNQSDHHDAMFNLAVTLQQKGDIQLAKTHFEKVVLLDKYRFEAYFNLVFLCNKKPSSDELKRWQSLFDSIKDRKDAYWLSFTLGRCYEQLGNYQQSFQYYQQGRSALARRKPYTINADVSRFETIKHTITKPKNPLRTSKQLLFITGMPRSGTTLTEQILASHSNVFATGESGIIATLARKVETLTARPFYEGLQYLSKADQSQLQKILDDWQEQTNKPYIVDTSTSNVQYVGFIMALFEKVKVIFCKRSPMDTCISIYQHPLSGANRYANTLDTLASYYRLIIDLSEHWRTLFADSYQELLYEQLVTNPEAEITQLLDYLNLTMDVNCLTPDRTNRLIKTPSATAVREPISTSAIGRWKHYQYQLENLWQDLEDLEQLHQTHLVS